MAAIRRRAVVGGLVALASGADACADYVQVKCDANDKYVAFIMIDAADLGKSWPYKHVVSFEERGLAIGLPPVSYAPKWTDVDTLVFKVPKPEAETGILEFTLVGEERTSARRIGLVEYSCWSHLVQFIRAHNIAVKAKTVVGEVRVAK